MNRYSATFFPSLRRAKTGRAGFPARFSPDVRLFSVAEVHNGMLKGCEELGHLGGNRFFVGHLIHPFFIYPAEHTG
jgi:hypothetical protein